MQTSLSRSDFFTQSPAAEIPTLTILCRFSMDHASVSDIALPSSRCVLCWLCYFDIFSLIWIQMVQQYTDVTWA